MKKTLLSLVLVLISSHICFGMAVGLSLEDAIERADVIAHIRITDDLEVIPRFTRTESKNGTVSFSTNSNDPDKYRNLAIASIVHDFKGSIEKSEIKIQHTNGYGCPNVIYRVGEEYIVFLRKDSDSDTYVTMNFYAGQFRMEADQVVAFYLMSGYKHPDDLRLPYERVSAFLKKAIRNNKRG